MNRIISLSNIDLLKVRDEVTGRFYCGSNQDWYSTERQQSTGCASSTAANLLLYECLKYDVESGTCDRKCLLSLMEDTWSFITPKVDGISSTALFIEGLDMYAKSQRKKFRYFSLDVSSIISERPTLPELVRFISQGLNKDMPIAFLNLCNGEERKLERWHWVTVVALEYTTDEKYAWVSICDEGIRKKINLSLWLRTTILGGGFAYFTTT